MTNLQGLWLDNNQLTGTIPTEIGNLTNLTQLALYNNQLTGSLTTIIGNLTNLTDLFLHANQLTGSIPAEIGNLTSLLHMGLATNQLTGSIPAEIGNLTQLKDLRLHNNQLSGAVPDGFTNFTNLHTLHLHVNELTDFPDLSSVTSLNYELRIESNRFTFEDIEPNVGICNKFTYSPQDSVGIEQDTTVNPGSSLTVSVSVGGANNQYQWYKDGANIGTQSSDSSYTIDPVDFADAGVYTFEITNTIATELTLYSKPINVTVIDTTAPAVPENLTATPGNKQVTLRWNRNTESDLHKYNIYRDTSSPATSLVDSVLGSPPDTFYTDTGLTNGQIYYYRITAVDSARNESGYSEEVNATPLYLGLVWYVSTTGSDEKGDGSEENPFATIQHGIDMANEGDTVLVHPGRYVTHNNLVVYEGVTLSIKPGVEVRFDGYYQFDIYGSLSAIGSEENQIVFTSNNPSPGPGDWRSINFVNAEGSILQYCRVEYGSWSDTGYWYYGAINCDRSSPEISYCLIQFNEHGGIVCHDYSEPTISNNRIAENGWSGIKIHNDSSPSVLGNVISNNGVYGGGEFGKVEGIVFNSRGNPSFVNNVIVNHPGAGILAHAGIHSENVSNNTIVGNVIGLNIFEANVIAYNNIIWSNTTSINVNPDAILSIRYSDVKGGWEGEGNIDADPLFVDPTNNDYHIQLGSPCIDAGDPNSSLDPDNTRADMGAYYFDQSIDITPPSAPQNLTATPGNKQVTLRWNRNTESDLHKYNIYRDTSSPATSLVDSVLGSPPDTFYTDTGLTNGQIYYYRITAVDSARNESGYSEEVNATPLYLGLVWYVSTTGSDETGDGSENNPFATIQHGIDVANKGDTVMVLSGIYYEEVSLKSSIVLKGESPEVTTILGNVHAGSISDVRITGFTVTDDNTAAFHIYNSELTITNCIAYNQPHNCVHCYDNSSVTLINNTFINNGNGCGVGNNSSTILRNNIIANNQYGGISADETSSAICDYNDLWGNDNNFYGNISSGSNNIFEDPLFVDPTNNDYRLRWGSPCIDAGDTDLDDDGVTWEDDPDDQDPDGTRMDMGAFYFPQFITQTSVSSIPDIQSTLAPGDSVKITFADPFDPGSVYPNIQVNSIDYGDFPVDVILGNYNKTVYIKPQRPYPFMDKIEVVLKQGITNTEGFLFDYDGDGELSDYTLNYRTSLLADYNTDFVVNFDDLITFRDTWWDKEQIDITPYELHPFQGQIPNVMVEPDGVFAYDELMTFIYMWNWSHDHGGSASKPTIAKTISTEPRINFIPYYGEKDPWRIGSSIPINLEVILNNPSKVSAIELVLEYDPDNLSYKGIKYNDFFNTEDNQWVTIDHNKVESGKLIIDMVSFSKDHLLPAGSNLLNFIELEMIGEDSTSIDYCCDIRYHDRSSIDREVANGNYILQTIQPLPESYELKQNYPNPFNPYTTIRYALPEQARVSIIIYDILGKQVKTLVNKVEEPGYRSIVWDSTNDVGSQVSAGLYIYRMQAGEFSQTKKVILLK